MASKPLPVKLTGWVFPDALENGFEHLKPVGQLIFFNATHIHAVLATNFNPAQRTLLDEPDNCHLGNAPPAAKLARDEEPPPWTGGGDPAGGDRAGGDRGGDRDFRLRFRF